MKATRKLTFRQRAAKLPKTASQKWAKRHGASLGGRERLGKLTVGQYWVRASGRMAHSDLRWIARTVVPMVHSESGPVYSDAMKTLLYGPESDTTVVQFRKRAAGVVSIPVELL